VVRRIRDHAVFATCHGGDVHRSRGVRRFALLATGLTLTLAPAARAATIWTVTRTDDPAPGTSCVPGDCSLRQAIAMQAPASGDSVHVPASATPYLLAPALGRIVINKSLTLSGDGAASTRVSGGDATPIFGILGPGSPTIDISAVTLTHGYDNVTAPGTPAGGGAIGILPPLAVPIVRLTDVAVVDNKVRAQSGNALGGGLAFGGGTVTLDRVLLARNEVRSGTAAAFGAGINSGANTTIRDSTVTANTAIAEVAAGTALGGGIATSGTLALRGVTVASNTATNLGLASGSTGGNLVTDTSGANVVTIANTILADGSAGTAGSSNCHHTGGTPVSSFGGNLESLNQCGLGAGELHDTNPLLGPLAANGGATDTLALLDGSPALHAGVAALCSPSDQRGLPRPSPCSIGAYEPQPVVTPPTETTPTTSTPTPAPSRPIVPPNPKPVTPAAPKLGALTLSRKHFRAGGRKPTGTTIKLRISSAATLRLSVKGHKGSLTRKVNAGAVSLRFSGHLRGKALRPGRYVLTLVATDAAGRRSATAHAAFTIDRK
jgi:hypothetical protein